MATSGRGSGVVGYNVQTVVDTENHLIIAHEVTNSGSDRSQLANMGRQAKAVLGVVHGGLFHHGVVAFLGFGWRDVADGLEQAAVIEPVDPFERRVFDGLP